MDTLRRAGDSLLIQTLALMVLLCVLPVQQVRKPTSLWDPDIWWHLRVGHWIMQHHSVPHSGIFSQIGEGRPWQAYSWGFEVTVAALQRYLDIVAQPLFVIIFGLIFTLLLFALLRSLSTSFWFAWLLTLLAVWSANLNISGAARPVSFSIAFFSVELWLVLMARRTHNPKYLYLLPGLFLIWANFHIQFVYGFLLPGLLALVATLDTWARNRQTPRRNGSSDLETFRPGILWGIVLGCVLATLLNPYGVGLYRTILIYLRSSFTYRFITELQALNFRDSAHYTELMLMAAAFFVLGRRSRTDFFNLALLVIVSLVAFRTLRDAWFVCITSAAIIADSIWQIRQTEKVDMEGPITTGLGPLRTTAALIGAVFVVLLSAADSDFNRKSMLEAVRTSYPVDASKYVEEHRPPGPLFNNFNWGGFLISALPDYPVASDGRNDLYGDELLHREVETIMASDWTSDPALTRANLVVIPVQLPLCQALERSPQFRLVYADKVAKVFVRVS